MQAVPAEEVERLVREAPKGGYAAPEDGIAAVSLRACKTCPRGGRGGGPSAPGTAGASTSCPPVIPTCDSHLYGDDPQDYPSHVCHREGPSVDVPGARFNSVTEPYSRGV